MDFSGKNVVITGSGSGIGACIARAASLRGARVIASDISGDKADEVAREIGGKSFACDVSKEEQVKDLVRFAEDAYGPIDLFCSNAGLGFGEPSHAASADNQVWETCWQVHVMAHVYASRAVLPGMIKRGSGYLVSVASAAGLLNQIGDAAYSTTKHAAVGLAEALAITHGADGIKVSVVCPQYVATPLLGYTEKGASNDAAGVISAEQVAETVMQGIEEEKFLILTHPEVHEFILNKATDTDRWITGMQRLRDKIIAAVGSTRLEDMHKMFRK